MDRQARRRFCRVSRGGRPTALEHRWPRGSAGPGRSLLVAAWLLGACSGLALLRSPGRLSWGFLGSGAPSAAEQRRGRQASLPPRSRSALNAQRLRQAHAAPERRQRHGRVPERVYKRSPARHTGLDPTAYTEFVEDVPWRAGWGQGYERPKKAVDVDTKYAEGEDEGPTGQIKYYGLSITEALPIFGAMQVDGAPVPDVANTTDYILPGDMVGAEPDDSTGFARLVDGRGFLDLNAPGLEEVDPWAAKLMRKPGVSPEDIEALRYVSMDDVDDCAEISTHLALPRRVVKNLKKMGIDKASPIQEAVIARAHRGESLCLQSQTGSGKTLAMVLPLLTAMAEESEWGYDGDKIIIVTHTREHAVQLFSEIDAMGFYPQGRGYCTTIIVGNLPKTQAIQHANIIIGTPNELSGVLHKTPKLIRQMLTQLRGIILDEVDAYLEAPRIKASRWNIRKIRKRYLETKRVLDPARVHTEHDPEKGIMELFLKRQLAYSRRSDFQVLAGSATMCRDMARKVFRLLRWDPLGRWYGKPPPLLRPAGAMDADWQKVPRMPTIPLHIDHRYVQVVKAKTDYQLDEDSPRQRRRAPRDGPNPREISSVKKWWYDYGLRKQTVASSIAPMRNIGMEPVSWDLAKSLLDGLHDALQSRGPGGCMVVISKGMGLGIREVVEQLHKWEFYEAQALHEALWEDPKDWPSQWAIKYSYDQVDRAPEIAQKHAELNRRLREGDSLSRYIEGVPEWFKLKERAANGQTTAPILVTFEEAGRGLHFDGVETVYMVGLPTKPATYLHIAGRVGRLGQKNGKAVSVISENGVKVLRAWSRQIGPDVQFREEPIARNRSLDVWDVDMSPSERRMLRRERQAGHAPGPHGPWAELPEGQQEDRLLPPGQDYVSFPGGDGEAELEPEYVREVDRSTKDYQHADLEPFTHPASPTAEFPDQAYLDAWFDAAPEDLEARTSARQSPDGDGEESDEAR